jgi:rhodanese-related sulfurtransferase
MQQPISKTELLQLADKQTTVKLIDIRSAAEFEKMHIPEAVNIPSEVLENNLQSFSKNDMIVCICNHGKERSQKAAAFLYNAGFTNTHYLTGGVGGWYAIENNVNN